MRLTYCLPFELGLLQPAVALLLLLDATCDTHYELATTSVAVDEDEDIWHGFCRPKHIIVAKLLLRHSQRECITCDISGLAPWSRFLEETPLLRS